VLGAAVYSRWIESRWLGVGRPTVNLTGRALPNPVKILQLSDLHASDVVPLDFIAKAVRLGLEQQPDLVFVTGDFLTGRFDRLEDYAKVLRPLSERLPCFATLGNHDGGRWASARRGYESTENVRELLVQSGITLLHNRSTELGIQKSSICLIGLGDVWAGEFAPKAAFAARPTDEKTPVLVLSHNPDTKEQLRDYHWDVMFCGHTHGGQLQIPLVGAPFAPVRDKRFVKGLHQWEGGRWIYISKGVGNLLGCRFNCRPEVSLITLV